jgi:Spy/CpxP family protein refolding chaperone
MSYREIMLPAVIGAALTFATSSFASALDNSIAGQPMNKRLIVAEAHQHNEKSSGGMMGHMKKMMKHKGKMKHGGHSYAHMIATHADELGLSDAQLGRIVRLHMKHAPEHKQFKKKIRQSMMHFHHASMKPGTDDATLRKLSNDHVEAFKAMVEQHIRSRNVVHAILTAEQREQLKAIKMNHGMHGRGNDDHKSHGKHSQRYY